MFYDFVQDFTPHFNYDIIIKGDSVFMEDQVVIPVYPQCKHYHLILVRIQSFQVSRLQSVITRNHQYLLNYENIENLA